MKFSLKQRPVMNSDAKCADHINYTGSSNFSHYTKSNMSLSSHFWVWGLLAMSLATSAARAQSPVVYPTGNAYPTGNSVSPSYTEEAIPLETVLERLERAEAQIQALEEERQRFASERFEVPSSDSFDFTSQSTQPAPDKDQAAASQPGKAPEKDKPKAAKWYDKLSIRGYAQFRINGILDEAAGSAPAQHVGDRSVGEDQDFLVRRARVIISGDVSDHLYVYLQPDFASSVPGSSDAILFGQVRDWYGDCYVDVDKVHRFRVGQSKVPYGWENMQSSSNRIQLDRNDGLNSAVRNERDLGVFYYWTPQYAQDFFKEVLDEGLKGSGNYGVFGFGVYNGQGGSLAEQNDNLHLVARLTIPYQFDNGQRMEVGLQGYTGKYTVLSSPISPLGIGAPVRPLGTLETNGRPGILDERAAASFIWYPQPWGFQAEWNVGRGPGLNDEQTAVVERALYGGYVMTMYKYDTDCWGTFFPFLRYNHFEGGYKPERNAPFSFISEWETGVEWQLNKHMELTAMYTVTDRTNTTAVNSTGVESYQQFEGQLARFQFQINY